MKHLIVGAGATFAEALALGNSVEKCPPLIRDFARKMWANYTPHPYLEIYLQRIGHPNFDPRKSTNSFLRIGGERRDERREVYGIRLKQSRREVSRE
jgi:hypothetical protein